MSERMSDSLESTYNVLAELKRIDDKAYRTRVDIDRIPEQIAKLQSALDEKRAKLDNARLAFESCEKKLRTSEAELREREDRLTKAEGKMMEVKTNAEYQAAMKENQTQKDAKGGLEERVLTLITEVEEQRKTFKALEAEFKKYESEIEGEKSTLEGERQKLVEALEQSSQVRNAKSAELNPNVQDLYARVCAISKTNTIVFADAGMCRGCNIQLRPQLYNEILGFRAVHRCGSCGKILIIGKGKDDSADASKAD